MLALDAQELLESILTTRVLFGSVWGGPKTARPRLQRP